MIFVLADLHGSHGHVSKDTVVGGYGTRLVPFTRATQIFGYFKSLFHDPPSIQLGYIAAILAQHGHEVVYTAGRIIDGDVAIVLSSLVDYRHEIQWADRARARGLQVGFIGLAASKLPHLFENHADFVIIGEPEAAVMEMASGRRLTGHVVSPAIEDLDSLPFPRWDMLKHSDPSRHWKSIGGRRRRSAFPLLASRSCPEFCTYCPHRILSSYRARSLENVTAELEELCRQAPHPHIFFRDPLFTQQREHCLKLMERILSRNLNLRFDCETRLDRLDEELLTLLHRAGLRHLMFGVESVSGDTLHKVGRRPIPEEQQREVMRICRGLGIVTTAFYVLGLPDDDWRSIAATVEYSIELGSTIAQFKILTPYPGTPLGKRLEPLVYEKDWQCFDGFTPTFKHPHLSPQELKFLLGSAYARFYMRPSYLAGMLRIHNPRLLKLAQWLDAKTFQKHSRKEIMLMSRPVTC